MISPKMLKALNTHLNEEFYSSYLYLSMAAYFEAKNLKGFANWMRLQSDEEQLHGMKFFDFILQKGGKVSLAQIDAPKVGMEIYFRSFFGYFKARTKNFWT